MSPLPAPNTFTLPTMFGLALTPAREPVTDAGNTANSISTPGDLNLLFGPPYEGNAGGAARISSNSWGASSNNYDVLAMSVDQFMWDHKDFLICFSNGNDFAAAMVGTPAVNKDGIGVGATQNGTTAGVKASFVATMSGPGMTFAPPST